MTLSVAYPRLVRLPQNCARFVLRFYCNLHGRKEVKLLLASGLCFCQYVVSDSCLVPRFLYDTLSIWYVQTKPKGN